MDHGASSYRRYLDGDEAAFEEIVREYFDNLVWFLDSYVHDLSAAEDIAIDAFSDLVVNKDDERSLQIKRCLQSPNL